MCCMWRARVLTKKSFNDKLLHLFINIRTVTLQYNNFEALLFNIISNITLSNISVMFQKSKKRHFNIFVSFTNPVHGTGTCVYMSKCILLAPSVATKTAWHNHTNNITSFANVWLLRAGTKILRVNVSEQNNTIQNILFWFLKSGKPSSLLVSQVFT